MKYKLTENIKFVLEKYPWADYEIYRKLMLTISISVILFFTIFSYLYFKDLINAFVIGIFSGAVIIALFHYYPITLRKHYLGRIEKDLPFFLMDLDIKLSIGMNFVSALENTSKEYNFLGTLLRKSLNQYDKGIPFHKSFLDLSTFYDSQDFKRALNQIYSVYQSGYGNTAYGPLFILAEELLDKQKSESKVYHSKLVMLSLLFIGATALLPSLFLVFVTIGGSIIEIGISGVELILIFVVLFPMIDLIIIFIIYNIMPSFLR